MLKRAGIALYGPRWSSGFRDEFGLSPRRLKRIVAGDEMLNRDVAALIETALRDRCLMLDEIMLELV